VLLAAGLIAAVATTPFFVWGVVYWTTAHIDSTLPESCNVHHIRQLAAGRTIFPEFREPHGPHVMSGHGPFFYLLSAIPCHLAGGSERAARLGGRLMALAAFLTVTLLVFLALRRRGEGWSVLARPEFRYTSAAAVAAYLLLTNQIFYTFTTSCRPDCLAAALSLGGFLLVCERRTTARLLVAGVLFLLAAFSKQTFLAAAAAMTVWMVARKEERLRGIVFGLLFGASGLLVLLLLHWKTSGLSTLHMIKYTSLPAPSLSWGLKLVIVPSLGAISPLLLPALAALVLAARRRALRPVHVYLLFALAIAVGTSFKTGSSRQFFIEITVVAALLLPDGLSAISRLARPPRLAFAALLLVLLSSYMLKPVHWIAGKDPVRVPIINLYAGRIRLGEYPELHRRAREAKGEILVTDSNTELLYMKEPLSLDWNGYAELVNAGLVSPDDIRENVRLRRYAFIACLDEFFRALFGSREELEKYYRPDGEEAGPIHHFRFFVPRETPESGEEAFG